MTIPEIVGLAIGCLIIACGIIIAVFFLCGYLTFKDLCHRKESLDKLEQSPYVGALGPHLNDFCEFRDDAYKALKGTSFSWESITSVDDVRLFGRFYKVADSLKTVICVPGYLTSGVQCFASLIPFYMEKGYNVLVVTNRGQAESGGKHVTFGKKEAEDLKVWIDKANELVAGGEIIIHGIDVGAVSALLASKELGNEVKGIISDSTYSKPWDVFVYQIKQIYHLSPFPILHVAEYFSQRFAKVSFRDSAVKAVAESSIPTLFIHGAKDMFIPYYMTSACYESCASNKKLLLVDGAGHAQAMFKDPDAYKQTVIEFLESL